MATRFLQGVTMTKTLMGSALLLSAGYSMYLLHSEWTWPDGLGTIVRSIVLLQTGLALGFAASIIQSLGKVQSSDPYLINGLRLVSIGMTGSTAYIVMEIWERLFVPVVTYRAPFGFMIFFVLDLGLFMVMRSMKRIQRRQPPMYAHFEK